MSDSKVIVKHAPKNLPKTPETELLTKTFRSLLNIAVELYGLSDKQKHAVAHIFWCGAFNDSEDLRPEQCMMIACFGLSEALSNGSLRDAFTPPNLNQTNKWVI